MNYQDPEFHLRLHNASRAPKHLYLRDRDLRALAVAAAERRRQRWQALLAALRLVRSALRAAASHGKRGHSVSTALAE